MFKINSSGLKYDFIINKHGNPNDIKLEITGVDKLKLKNNNIEITTSVNKIIEYKPYAYQIINGKKKQIKCKYFLQDNIISFYFPQGYDTTKQLIIDPSLIFSTYSGSTADNWGMTATFDSYGNVYSGGIAFDVGYPTTIGAYQQNFAGGVGIGGNYANGCDIAIIKYTPDGTSRLWATYLGGTTGEELPHSLVCDAFDNLLIFGTTGSNDFPVTANAYDISFNGGTSVTYDNVILFPNGTDIYVTKLSEDGTQLLASTYIGGSKNDGFNFRPNYANEIMHGNDSLYYNYADGARGEVIADSKYNVYVGTCTFSDDFPTTSNAFQPTSNGKQEGIVFKFDQNLSNLIFSSYFGGTEDDAIYSIDVGVNDDVYVAGGTSSQDLFTTPNAYKHSYQGGTTDGFVAHISKFGNQIIGSTFFGSNNYDQAYFVRLDKTNNIYITGQTKATGSTLIYNAIYNTPNSGQFITKLTNSLDTIIWSTTFGTGNGKPNISITAFAVDICNRIYLSGWGREWALHDGNTWASIEGTKNMDITPGAYQSITDGQDFYIMVMADDASYLDYSSFFGEQYTTGYSGHDHVDGGTSRFDNKGNIYQSICASCGGFQDFPTYPNPGVWSNNNNAGNCNNAVFRFSFADDFSLADFDIPPVGCAPYIVNFNNTSTGGIHYIWDFGDGSPLSNDTNPTHTYTNSGIYLVTLIASDSSSCNLADTVTKQIQVLSNSTDTIAEISICLNQAQQIGVAPNGNPNVTYEWSPSTGLSDTTVANPYANPTDTTTYVLVISNGVCGDTLYQTVNVIHNNININAFNDTTVCKGELVNLYAIANQNADYIWSSTNQFSDTLNSSVNDSSLTTNINNQTYLYVQAIDNECNYTDYDSVLIDIYPINAQISNDTMICLHDTITLSAYNTIANDTLIYSWNGSSIISGANSDIATICPVQNTTYVLWYQNQHGCSQTDTVNINVENIYFNNDSVINAKCYGDCNGEIYVNVSAGLPYNITWSNGNTGNSNINLCPGNYTLTVTDNIGCNDTINLQIQQPSILDAQITNIVDASCNGLLSNTGSASVNVSGGTPGYFYNWNTGDNSATADSLYAGNYSVTITDNNGCDTILSVFISDQSSLEIQTQSTPALCFGDCNGTATVNITTTTTSPYQYNWSNSQTTQTINNLCSGYYQVTVIDNDNCLRSDTVFVAQPLQITTSISNEQIICYGDSSLVTINNITGGTPPYNYTWNNGSTNDSIYLNAGSYFVTVSDINNCSDTVLINITQPDSIYFDTTITPLACYEACNGSAKIIMHGGVSPYIYHWNTGTTIDSIHDVCSGNYHLTVSDALGCTNIVDFNIGISSYTPPLNVTTDNYYIYQGQSTNLYTNTSYPYYFWSPSNSLNSDKNPNVIATPNETTTYLVKIIDKYGCANTDTITIFVSDLVCNEPYIYVPNAFTPNNDGKNDILYVYGNVIDDLYFAIYDRWGELIFVTTDINKGWDGTYKGKPEDPAVFVYYLRATCLNKQTFIRKGNITLIR